MYAILSVFGVLQKGFAMKIQEGDKLNIATWLNRTLFWMKDINQCLFCSSECRSPTTLMTTVLHVCQCWKNKEARPWRCSLLNKPFTFIHISRAQRKAVVTDNFTQICYFTFLRCFCNVFLLMKMLHRNVDHKILILKNGPSVAFFVAVLVDAKL